MAYTVLLGLTSQKKKLDFNCLFSIVFLKNYKNNFLNMQCCKFPSPVLLLDLEYFENNLLEKQ